MIGAAGEASRRTETDRGSTPGRREPPPVASALRAAASGRRRQPAPDDRRRPGRGEDRPRRSVKEDLRRQKSSPLVRRIAKEHNVDIKLIKGTGISGRVTKQDILGFIQSGAGAASARAAARQSAARPAYARREA